MTKEIKKRLQTEVDGQVPLGERLDLGRLKAALDEPLFMDTYLHSVDALYFGHIPPTAFNSCGTIGCIAGNAVMNEMAKTKRGEDTVRLAVAHNVPNAGRLILRLTQEEAVGPADGEDGGLFSITFPSGTPGTRTYGAKVRKAVKAWLKERGVKW